jgi:hypothetical protein
MPNYDCHFIPPHVEILSVAIAALGKLQKSVAADRTRQARLRANSCSRQPVGMCGGDVEGHAKRGDPFRRANFRPSLTRLRCSALDAPN